MRCGGRRGGRGPEKKLVGVKMGRAGSGSGLRACPVCGRLVSVVGPVGSAGWGVGVVPGPRGPAGWRVVGQERRVRFAVQPVACGPCGGRVPGAAPPPVWRAAREAWAGVTDPELLRFAPKKR